MEENLKNRYLINVFSNFIGHFSIGLLSFFCTPLIIKLLGNLQFGIYRTIIFSIGGYVFLLNFGIDTSVQRFFLEGRNRKNWFSPNQIVSLLFKVYFFLCLIGVIVLLSGIFWLPSLLKIPPNLINGTKWIIFSSAVLLSCNFANSIFNGVILGCERFDLSKICFFLKQLQWFIFAIGGLQLIKADLFTLSILVGLSGILSTFCFFAFAKIAYPELQLILTFWNSSVFYNLAKFSTSGFMIAVGPIAVYNTQDILIARYLDLKYVTYFSVAALLVTQIRTACSAIASPILAISSNYKFNGNKIELQKIFIRTTSLTLWVWAAIAFPLALYSKELLFFWVGEEFVRYSSLVLILLIGNFGSCLQFPASYILSGSGDIKWLGYSQICMGVTAVASMFIALKFTKLGLLGIAFAVSLPVAVRSVFVIFSASKQVHVSCFILLTTVSTNFFYLALPIALIVIPVSLIFQPTSLFHVLLLMLLLSSMIGIIGCYLILFSTPKNVINAILKGIAKV